MTFMVRNNNFAGKKTVPVAKKKEIINIMTTDNILRPPYDYNIPVDLYCFATKRVSRNNSQNRIVMLNGLQFFLL